MLFFHILRVFFFRWYLTYESIRGSLVYMLVFNVQIHAWNTAFCCQEEQQSAKREQKSPSLLCLVMSRIPGEQEKLSSCEWSLPCSVFTTPLEKKCKCSALLLQSSNLQSSCRIITFETETNGIQIGSSNCKTSCRRVLQFSGDFAYWNGLAF